MSGQRGLTLVELLVAMAIATLTGAMILKLVLGYQGRILAEVARNDLQDRAERLLRFVADDVREAAFLLGAQPKVVDQPLRLVHDSLSGDPQETFNFALLPEDTADGDDALTLVKAVSFAPPLLLAQPAAAGNDAIALNRRPNVSPGSSRELIPAPEAISHLVLENQRGCYAVQAADQTLYLEQPLTEDAPAGCEVLGVRAVRYHLDPWLDSNRLRRDDFTSRDILDDGVDGLQFRYLLRDGTFSDQPADPATIRAVQIALLVRDHRADANAPTGQSYLLGNRSYGPFGDRFRRVAVTQTVEVKNHGL